MAIPYPHFIGSEQSAMEKGILVPSPSSSSSSLPPVILTQDELKKIAAYKAVEYVKSGMVLGLGTGSTAKHAVARIGELLSQGKLTNIVGIPTSKMTHEQALSVGIPLSDLDSHPVIDLAIDGADEVDPYLNLVKGRGGSLLREKMVEGACKKFVVIVDESKMVKHLGGSGLAMPVEIIPFCWKFTAQRLQNLFEDAGCVAKLRAKEEKNNSSSLTPKILTSKGKIYTFSVQRSHFFSSMGSFTRSLLLPLFISSILLLSDSVKCDDHGDKEDLLLQSINQYRASLNLTALVKNDNAECLADELSEQFQNRPCTNSTGANTVPGTEPQFANYPNILNKCRLNVSNTRDGAVLPACVPNLESSLVLTNFTRSQYSNYLNDTKYTGIGIGSEDNWIIVVLTTNTAEGSFVPAQTSLDADDDEEDLILRGINTHRASLMLTQLTENDRAECFAGEFADRFQDQPCTNTTGSVLAPGTEPQFRLSSYPMLLAKCNLITSNTTDGVVLPVCVPRSSPSLALSDLKRSPYGNYLNDTTFTVAGIGSEDNWFVVVLTSNTVVGNPAVPAGTPGATTPSPLGRGSSVNTIDSTSFAAPKISFTYYSLFFLIASALFL